MYMYTNEQNSIFEWVKNGSGNATVMAVAGAGKTTTLVEALKYMNGSVFLGAYNKSIADEIQKRTENMKNVFCRTLHSAGFSTWKKANPNCEVDGYKIRKIADDMGLTDQSSTIEKLVGFAKQRGFGILYAEDDMSRWEKLITHYGLEEETMGIDLKNVFAIFKKSLELACKVVDFEDMLFCPLYFKHKFWQYDWVLIDEAQDINPIRRLLCKKLLKPSGRFIAVGDPHQAIYGFTGADSNSLQLIQQEFNTIEHRLSTTFRCPKQIVNLAKRYVNHIECWEGAQNGRLEDMEYDELLHTKFAGNEAILCRNTKPLLETANALLMKGVKCHVVGNEICSGLIALCSRWKRITTTEELRQKLKELLEKQQPKLTELQFENLQDKVEAVRSLSSKFKTVKELSTYLKELFSDKKGGVSLCTVHKSKGMEWDTVYILGRSSLMPSKKATKDWELQQERNLLYVAITRARKTLVDVNISK